MGKVFAFDVGNKRTVGEHALTYYDDLTVLCPRRSYAWKLYANSGISVKALDDSSAPGFFGKLFGKR